MTDSLSLVCFSTLEYIDWSVVINICAVKDLNISTGHQVVAKRFCCTSFHMADRFLANFGLGTKGKKKTGAGLQEHVFVQIAKCTSPD